jgi:hypothetical protein
MPDQNAKGKPKYESPILVPLGGLARGSGACTAGSGYVGACKIDVIGTNPGGYAGDCTSNGAAPIGNCTAGVTATQIAATYCKAGTTASDYCNAGTCAPGAAGYCTQGRDESRSLAHPLVSRLRMQRATVDPGNIDKFSCPIISDCTAGSGI